MASFRRPNCICVKGIKDKDKRKKVKCKCGADWEYRIRYKDPHTREHKETSKRGFKTKAEAKQAAAKKELEIANKSFIPNSSVTYQQLFEEFWATHSRTIKKSSRYTSKIKYTKYALPYFGLMPIKEINKKHCQDFVNELAKKLKSVKQYKMYVNRVFKYAISEGYININPMDNVTIPKKEEEFLANDTDDDESERNYWEKEELLKFDQLAKKHMDRTHYMMFYMMFNLGLRKGETLALEWKDVNLKNATIRIRQTLYFENGEEIFQKVKNYENRTLYLDEEIVKELKKWKIKQLSSININNNNQVRFVISRQDLRPLRLAHPNDILNKFIKDHGLHPITVHGLRHTYATLLFEAGATIPEVKEQLGHKDEKTTIKIYIHVTKKKKETLNSRFRAHLKS